MKNYKLSYFKFKQIPPKKLWLSVGYTLMYTIGVVMCFLINANSY